MARRGGRRHRAGAATRPPAISPALWFTCHRSGWAQSRFLIART